MLNFCETQENERSRSLLPKSKKIRKHKVEESEESARRVQRKTHRKSALASLNKEELKGTPSVASPEHGAQNYSRNQAESRRASLDLMPSGRLFSELEPLDKMELFPSHIQDILKANSLKSSEKLLGKISKLKSPSAGAFPNRIKKMRTLVDAQEQEVQRYLITMQSKAGVKALEQYNSMRNTLKTTVVNRNILREVSGSQMNNVAALENTQQERVSAEAKIYGEITVEIEENTVDLNVKKNRMSSSSNNSEDEFCVYSPAKTEASYNDIMSQENNRDEEFEGRKMNIIDRLFMNSSASPQFNQSPLGLERKISESLSSSRKRILSSSKVEDITDLLTEVISKSEEEDSLGMEEPNDIWNAREEELAQDSLSETKTPLNSFQNIPPISHYYTPQLPIQYFYNQSTNMLNYVKTFDFDGFMLDHDQASNTTY